MLVDLHNIVVKIQFSYHFKVQTSSFQLGLKLLRKLHTERETMRNINYHEFGIAPNFEGSAINRSLKFLNGLRLFQTGIVLGKMSFSGHHCRQIVLYTVIHAVPEFALGWVPGSGICLYQESLYRSVSCRRKLRRTALCRDVHSSLSSIQPTLLESLHLLQVHLAAVLCTFSTLAV